MKLFGCEVFSFEGRINRLLFIKQFVTLLIGYVLIGTLFKTTVTSFCPSLLPVADSAILVLGSVFEVGKICLFVRRFHDLGLSGYWVCALYLLEAFIRILMGTSIRNIQDYSFSDVIAVCGLDLVEIILIAFKGTSGPNKYGRDLLQPEVKEKSLDIGSETYFGADKKEPVNEHKLMGKKVNVKLFGHEIFSIAGRLNRAPFIRFALLALLLSIVNTRLFYQYLVIEKMLTENQIATGFLFLLSFVAFIVTHVAFCAVIIRRLHDLGSSEFWVTVYIGPGVASMFCDVGSGMWHYLVLISLVFTIFLSVFKGNSGPNQYGLDLLPSEVGGGKLTTEAEIQHKIEDWKYFLLCLLLVMVQW